MALTIFLYQCAYAFILWIFVQFLTYVNSSKIYQLTFFFLFIDFSLLESYEILLEKNNQDLLLYIPCIVLLALYTIVVFEIGGWRNLFDYISETFTGHVYSPIKIKVFIIIFIPIQDSLQLQAWLKGGKFDWIKFFPAITILTLSILKEMYKKFFILLCIIAYQYNSLFIFFVFLNHSLLFIILISLVPMDPKVVKFISQFFGPYVLGWLGSYQTLRFGKTKIEFVSISEFTTDKDNKK